MKYDWRQENKTLYLRGLYIEAVAKTCSVKKVFLEISPNSQENTCARVSISIKLQVESSQNLQENTCARVLFY